MKPHLLRDVNEECQVFYMEIASLKRRITNIELLNISISNNSVACGSGVINSGHRSLHNDYSSSYTNDSGYYPHISLGYLYQRKPLENHQNEQQKLKQRLRELESESRELEKLRKSSAFQRNFVYPLAMLLLLFFTGVTVLLVVQNTLELLIGIKALPLSTRVSFFLLLRLTFVYDEKN